MARLDLVIFGATGYTGKHAVEHLARGGRDFAGLSWGIAGRSQKKLEDLLQDIAKKTDADLSAVKIIVADVGDYDSVKQMCVQATVLVNCCGPYRRYGEPVVRAAIKSKTHYVDVSGEPQFIESMQLQYGAEATSQGVLVISACGLDSIPFDMGIIFLEEQFGGTLNSVESYLSSEIPSQYRRQMLSNGCRNYATWESLVHSLSDINEVRPLRKKIYPERLPVFQPKLKKRFLIHSHGGGWCFPLLGSVTSIVYRTQRYLYETEQKRPVQFGLYIQLPCLFYMLLLVVFGSVVMLMSKNRFTRQLLLDHPRIFSCGMASKEGPKRVVNENTRFIVELRGSGWASGSPTTGPPNKTLVAKVSAMDPSYGFTATALLLSAVTILKERTVMPTGGVLTTGVAFRKTNLIKKLQENNTTIEIVGNE